MRNDTSKTPTLLYTAREAAEALAISRRKLWSMTASGEIPHIRFGKCVRYSIDDLNRLIESRKKGGDVR